VPFTRQRALAVTNSLAVAADSRAFAAVMRTATTAAINMAILQQQSNCMRNLLDGASLLHDEILRFVNAGLHLSTCVVVQVFEQQ